MPGRLVVIPEVLRNALSEEEASFPDDCGRISVGLVQRCAPDDGAQHAHFGVLRRRNIGEVVGEHNEVGVFANFQFALLPFPRIARKRTEQSSVQLPSDSRAG